PRALVLTADGPLGPGRVAEAAPVPPARPGGRGSGPDARTGRRCHSGASRPIVAGCFAPRPGCLLAWQLGSVTDVVAGATTEVIERFVRAHHPAAGPQGPPGQAHQGQDAGAQGR